MIKRNEMIAYAMDFCSYLVSKIGEIEKIILHGSVARGDFNKDSDIDLFIDIPDISLKNKIIKLKDSYLETEAFKRWKLKGIINELSVIVGKLDSSEWDNLKRAIANTGIVLFSKYETEVKGLAQYSIFVFENIKPDSKRISVYRKLFGFKSKEKSFLGMIKELNGLRLGKGVFAVPIKNSLKIKDYFKEKKVKFQIYDVWSDNF